MDLFMKNLNYVQQTNPMLYQKICGEEIHIEGLSLEPFMDGLYNIVSLQNGKTIKMYDRDVLVHGIENMIKEVNGYRHVILYGLGLGYHLFKLMQMKDVKNIVVIEPDMRMFLIFMHLYDVEAIFNNEKLKLFVSTDEREIVSGIVQGSENMLNDRVRVCSFPFYEQNYKDLYTKFLDKFIRQYSGYVVSRNTAIRFQRQFVGNGLRNYKNHLSGSMMIDSLFHRFQNIPAIIVGAGPSLNKNIEQLRNLGNHALIFAVGSAINILDKKKIPHHFKVALDGSEMEAKYFHALEDTSTHVIYFPSLHHQALDGYQGQKYYGRLDVQFEYIYLEKLLNIQTVPILGGGTVSMATVDIAHKLGCNPIILMGQDFAYSDTDTYADGAVNKQLVSKTDGHVFQKIDIYGREVYTHEGLYTLKLGFDNFIEQYASKWDVKLYNCTEGGLGIKGVENAPLAEILERYCKEEHASVRQLCQRQEEKHDGSLGRRPIDEIYSKLHEDIQGIKNIVEEALKIIKDMDKTLKKHRNDQKILSLNNRLKRKLKELDSYDVLYQWIVPITESELFLIDDLYEKQYAAIEDIWEQQKVFVKMMHMQYERIQDMCGFLLDIIHEAENNPSACEGTTGMQ